MNPKFRQLATWIGYPLFYVVAFIGCAYVSVPWDRVKSALIDGFNESSPLKLQIEKLTWAWRFPGVAASGVKFIGAAPPSDPGGKPKLAPEYAVDDLFVRASILPLLWGTVRLGYSVDGFGGSIDGMHKSSGKDREMEVEFDDVDVAKLPYVSETLGVPLSGTLNGSVEMTQPEGKLNLAEGTLELTITGLGIGDGKTKIRDMIALPRVNAGDFSMKAEITEGVVKLTELNTKGTDLEVVGDGRVRLMDTIDSSLAELSLRFRFSDAYRNKDDTTRGILGNPVANTPGLFDLDPKMKKAHREDGFYAWQITGPFSRLSFQPGTSLPEAPAATKRAPRLAARPVPPPPAVPAAPPPPPPAPEPEPPPPPAPVPVPPPPPVLPAAPPVPVPPPPPAPPPAPEPAAPAQPPPPAGDG